MHIYTLYTPYNYICSVLSTAHNIRHTPKTSRVNNAIVPFSLLLRALAWSIRLPKIGRKSVDLRQQVPPTHATSSSLWEASPFPEGANWSRQSKQKIDMEQPS